MCYLSAVYCIPAACKLQLRLVVVGNWHPASLLLVLHRRRGKIPKNRENGDVGIWVWFPDLESWVQLRRSPRWFCQRLSPRLLPSFLGVWYD
ncbi:unnamed protein product [Linum tenue]|uniref:Secreted protein n=1 Tax=Linum tenue TaxID=586396 RepID=A0AAV0RWF0_9ROSI|nr:unnamed protein product [Linum tenue]